MQGTRERVLQLLLQRREARVEELAEALDITTAAVRRHLDHLRADGLVDARAVKQAMGRPYHAYYPTERALGSTAAEELLRLTLESLEARSDVVSQVSERVAESLAARHRGEVEAHEPGRRVVQVTESLRREGILGSWYASEDGFHLVNNACPYRKAAEVSRLPCESDRRAISLLLGQDVEQLNRIVDGAPVCEYLVRAERGPQDVIEVN